MATKEELKKRPLLQKLADAILPGGQFRDTKPAVKPQPLKPTPTPVDVRSLYIKQQSAAPINKAIASAPGPIVQTAKGIGGMINTLSPVMQIANAPKEEAAASRKAFAIEALQGRSQNTVTPEELKLADNYNRRLFNITAGVIEPLKVLGGIGKATKLAEGVRKIDNAGIMSIQDEVASTKIYNIFQELDTAQAGKRLHTEDGVSMAQKSTFPDWVPSELRSRSLFDSVSKHINEDTVPTKAAEKRLYNIVSDKISEAAGAPVSKVSNLGTAKELPSLAEEAKKYKTTAPSTLGKPSAVAQGEGSIVPSQQLDTPLGTQNLAQQSQGISPTLGTPPLAKLDLDKTLSRGYTEGPTIVNTSKQLKEPTSIVRRVVDKLRQAGTGLTEYVQDMDVRVRQLQEKAGAIVDEASDPYLKMTLYPGRVGAKINAGKEKAQAIIDELTQSGLTKETLSDYLVARHAPERNAAIGEKAAGITTAEAQAKLAALEASPSGTRLKAIANKAQELNNTTLDLLHNAGVISSDLLKTLRTKYKNHVPLNRIFEETDDIGSALSGKGFDVRSTGIKAAKGSERDVSDVLTNIITNYEQAVLRSEKNIVDNATLTFVRKNKDILSDVMEEVKPRSVGVDFAGKPLMESTNDPTIVQMFENGKRVWIKVKDPQLAIALKGVGKEKLPALLRGVASFTRFYSGLATRFNPEFALPNKIRDLQETIVYLSSQPGVGFKGAARTATRDPGSMKDIIDSLRGLDTEGTRLYKEMQDLGGTTGGLGLSSRQQVELSVKRLEKLANSKTKRIASNLVEYVDDFNTIFEDSTRLSVYKQAIASGMSKDRAAAMAKEASINFNRMGRGGPLINALYMFSNASIQGSTKMIKSLKNPKVLGATVATVAGAVGAVNEWNDMLDPNWRDKVSKYDRQGGLPIMLPSTDGDVHYITIPVSWGIKPIKMMSDYAYDAAAGKGFDAKEAIGSLLGAVANSYNPVGGTDFVSAISPTVLDVPVEIGRNQQWSGSKIRPDYDKNAPKDIQYFSSLGETKTGQGAISISEILKDKLNVKVSPADIKYAYDQYIGGAGRFIGKIGNILGGTATGKTPPLDEFPLLSRFYKERTAEEVGTGAGGRPEEIKSLLEEQSRERFRLKNEAMKEYNRLKEMSFIDKGKANTEGEKIQQQNPELFKKIREIATEDKKSLNYQDKLIGQLGVENGERAEYILAETDKLQTREEKNAYIEDLRSKGLVSNDVMEGIRKLIELKK